MVTKTYRTRLGCDNCGLVDWYFLPFLANFHSWTDSENPSYYELPSTRTPEPLNLVELTTVHMTRVHSPTCRNCGLSYLTPLQWTQADVPDTLPHFAPRTDDRASYVAQEGTDMEGLG